MREWLKGLARDDRNAIGYAIYREEIGHPVGMPTTRPLGDGLHEIRVSLHTRIARVIYLVKNKQLIVLHGFIKKTQETPKQDMELAKKRKRQWEKNDA